MGEGAGGEGHPRAEGTLSPPDPPPNLLPGLVAARLERRGEATVLVRQLTRYPLRLLEPRRPLGSSAAVLYLGMVAGGIQAGDRLEVALELGRAARALVTTQSASKLLTMREGEATQQLAFTLDEQAVLEYLPDEVIPFAGARFQQETRVRMAPSATLILWELLAPGRAARGERFAFERYAARLCVERGGRLALRDVLDLRPAEGGLDGPALLGGWSHVGTLAVLAPAADATLADALHEALAHLDGITGSASAGPELVVARVLGHSTQATKAALRAAWRIAHQHVLGHAVEGVPGKIVF